jgi:hypothetical protein
VSFGADPVVSERPGDHRSLLSAIIGDGRPLLLAVAASLVFAGGFVIFLAVTRQLLPHDLAYLDLTNKELDRIAGGRLVDFMVHDRVSWGATLIAIGVLYVWLIEFPLAAGQVWAWWVICITGAIGFASFGSYLAVGYLDTWHGIGTLCLLPVFWLGVATTRPRPLTWSVTLRPTWWGPPRGIVGRVLVVASGCGLVLAGATILTIGVTSTFVETDLQFIGVDRAALDSVSARLVPLVAHDRVGFAGGVIVGGLLVATVAWWGRGRAARQAIALAGLVAYGATLAVHIAVGYTDLLHLAPLLVGSVTMTTGLLVWDRPSRGSVG